MEDDDEICNCAARPYSAMPTVLELQQMRNRLNVAQAGKELMRYNSSRTGVEMKKISSDLQVVYTNFGRDMRRAFLLLARCRYFNQDFYRNVTESVKSASVHVQCTFNTLAGVKMLSFKPLEISNTKVCKCPFLCRGGQAIQEAKKAWSNLLRSHIKMVELRMNFQAIDAAYRISTKRLNIINQIVLPKTQATINYILIQLEEITREESHRIRVKSSKLRNSSNISYVCSGPVFTYFKPTKDKKDGEGKKHLTPNTRSIREILPPGESLNELQSEPIKAQIDQPTSKDVSQVIDVYEPISKQKSRQRINSLINFYEYVSTGTESLFMETNQRMSLGDFDPRKDLPKKDKATYAIDGLLEACKLTRNRLNTFASNEKPCQVDFELTVPLGQLKSHIDAVIQANIRLQSSAFISKSVRNFIKSCEKIDKNLMYAIKDIDTIPLDKNGKKRIQHLINSIDDVVKIITDYRSEGLLTPSLEEFSKVCTETKVKIGFYNIKRDLQKIDILKSYISNLESITTDITRDGVKTPSIQNFLSSCKCFREKLEEHKRRKKQPISEHKVIKSIKHNQEAETNVTLTGSVQQFISSCENVMRRFRSNESMKVIESLYGNSILSLMTNLQNQGLLSKSTIAFLTTKSKTLKLDENNDFDICSCQSDTCERFSELHSILPAARVEEKENKLEEMIPNIDVQKAKIELEVKEDKNDEHLGKVETIVAKVKQNYSKVKEFRAKVKENKAKPDEKADFDYSKPTQFPSKIEEENEEHPSYCSFELSEISEAFCSNSSCTRSDIIVAEINTYDSCPIFKSNNSNTWKSQSSDSWTKPLLPKENYCAMCYSRLSSNSSDRQVCEDCEKTHGKEEIVRALAKTYTM